MLFFFVITIFFYLFSLFIGLFHSCLSFHIYKASVMFIFFVNIPVFFVFFIHFFFFCTVSYLTTIYLFIHLYLSMFFLSLLFSLFPLLHTFIPIADMLQSRLVPFFINATLTLLSSTFHVAEKVPCLTPSE